MGNGKRTKTVMEEESLKRTCYGCLALDRYSYCHCLLGKKVEPMKHLTKNGMVNTAKPLEPCVKPKSNRWYVWELEHRIRILEEVIKFIIKEKKES